MNNRITDIASAELSQIAGGVTERPDGSSCTDPVVPDYNGNNPVLDAILNGILKPF